MILRIHEFDKQKIDYVMDYTTETSSVSNTIKKFHIQFTLHSIYQQNLYHDKQKEMDALFDK